MSEPWALAPREKPSLGRQCVISLPLLPAAVTGHRFSCPDCGAPQSVQPADFGHVLACTGCHASVVAPEPRAGQGAVSYRLWLRAAATIAGEEIHPLSAGDTVRGRRLPVGGTSGRRGRRLRLHRLPTLSGLGLIMGMVIAAATGYSGLRRDPDLRRSPAVDAEDVTARPAPPEWEGSPTGPGRAPSNAPSLAALLDAGAAEPGDGVAVCRLAHSFERGAPSSEAFLCVQLIDPVTPSLKVRSYMAREGATAAAVESSIPWGTEKMAQVRLAWRPPAGDGAAGGFWELIELRGDSD